jgi:thioredoxin-related protein
MLRRVVISILCLYAAAVAPYALSNDVDNTRKSIKKEELLTLTNLQHVNVKSKTNCTPIVIMVSQFSCAYCDKLKKFVFIPIIRSREFTDKAVFRELLIDPNEMILDENGHEILGAKFAKKYIDNILTPTVLFLDSSGNELAERIIGIGNIDFYESYFEQSLADANSIMKKNCRPSISVDELALSKRKVN